MQQLSNLYSCKLQNKAKYNNPVRFWEGLSISCTCTFLVLTFFFLFTYIPGGAAHAGIKAGIHVELSGGISFFPPPAVETTVLKSDVPGKVGKFMRSLQRIPVLALYTHRRVGRMRKRKRKGEIPD